MDKKPLILIIDDEVKILELYANALKEAGLEALTASNGPEGIKIVEEKNPDLVLLDYKMPNMDGVQVLEKLKENPATAGVKVAFISAFGDPASVAGDEKVAKELGAITFIRKGFSLDELVSQVKDLLA